jgi:pantoate--beta-alanine ligase
VAIVIDSPSAARAWSDTARSLGHTIALVPTMGALHHGHRELIDAAAAEAEQVVVSIFVNPLQFGERNDFEHYPRPLEDDLRVCDEAGAVMVYVPTAGAMYAPDFSTNVRVTGLSEVMEGASRPGHFDGVATVVTKLFAATRPDVAVFGEKDYQQLAVVRRLVRDLDLGVRIVGHPTVREVDGLAMSSRNRRLTVDQRRAATCIPAAISAAVDRARSHDSQVADAIGAASSVIDNEPLARLDYIAVFDSTTLCPLDRFDDDHRRHGATRLAIAVRFGDVRLIDNTDLFARTN